MESIGGLTEDDVVGGLDGLGVAFLKLWERKESMSKLECIDYGWMVRCVGNDGLKIIYLVLELALKMK